MLKCYNQNICDVEEVWSTLDQSKKFGWSWCKELKEPYRHTAIVFYFDKTSRFTVNFRTEDGSSKAAAAFSEAKPLITIEKILTDASDMLYYSPFEEYSLFMDYGRHRAKDRIRSILSYEPGKYNLFFNNCRDHVKGVVKHILGKEIPDAEFERGMNRIGTEDATRKILVGTGAVMVTSVFAAGVAALSEWIGFGSTVKEEEEEETVTA